MTELSPTARPAGWWRRRRRTRWPGWHGSPRCGILQVEWPLRSRIATEPHGSGVHVLTAASAGKTDATSWLGCVQERRAAEEEEVERLAALDRLAWLRSPDGRTATKLEILGAAAAVIPNPSRCRRRHSNPAPPPPPPCALESPTHALAFATTSHRAAVRWRRCAETLRADGLIDVAVYTKKRAQVVNPR